MDRIFSHGAMIGMNETHTHKTNAIWINTNQSELNTQIEIMQNNLNVHKQTHTWLSRLYLAYKHNAMGQKNRIGCIFLN